MRFSFCLIIVFLFSSCGILSSGKNLSSRESGALVGGAMGAGGGAIIGNQFGNTGAGVAIGAGAGVVSGALVGDALQDRSNVVKSQEEILKRQQIDIERQRRAIEDLKTQKDANNDLIGFGS